MKYFLMSLLISIIIAVGFGFYIKTTNEGTGNFIIGLSLSALIFVLMPTFIYHRWKDKNVKDYMLSKENIKKMQDYQKEKKI